MGVTGLWRLIEPSGKPVPLETLENKVLAVDVSIWLHQAIKGFQDAQGAPLPNAHLLGIYHRVCKLLYFRVKPVFVFDGGVPNLKKETISKRNQLKSKKLTEAERIQKQLLTTLLKHSAVNKVLSEKARASLATKTSSSNVSNKTEKEDIYMLPPTDFDSTLSSSEDENTSGSISLSPTKQWDLHTIDEKSPHFKALPADVRHEILTELKETRKQSSWGRIHEMPKQSGDFSGFQMKRLLKRYSVQVSLEEAEKEMGGRSLSLAELETLLKDQGVVTSSSTVGSRIASDENTRYLLIKDVKKAMDEAKQQKESSDILTIKEVEEEDEEQKKQIDGKSECVSENKSFSGSGIEDSTKEPIEKEVINNASETAPSNDLEFQRDLEKAIQLSLQDVPSTSKKSNSGKRPTSSKHNFSFLEDFDDADFQSSSESEEDFHLHQQKDRLASVKSYMTEYSGLTPSEIEKIIGCNSSLPNKNKNHENVGSASKAEAVNTGSFSEIKNNTISSEDIENPVSKPELNEILIEENEDRTVSSTTSTVSKCQKIAANNFVGSCEVSSSTNSDVLNLAKTTTKASNDFETVEVISDDDASSDASDDFLEVSEKQNTSTKLACGFEILIKPEDALEDDIFSDIFSNEKKESNSDISKPTSSISNTDKNSVIQIVEPVVTIKDDSKNEPIVTKKKILDKELEISNSVDTTADEKGESSKTSIETNELTKEEQTRNILAEFKVPLQEKEDSKISGEEKSNIQTIEKNKILTTEQLETIEENLRQEKEELIASRSSKERIASNLTEQIYQEAQELLELFGVPYIVAPMEAEAQCAFLDDINLTDGTITDDSDIWLFGGKTVYKNFFNQHKHVMEFRAENIQHHFKLTREQMILLALLVGSDYTVGLQGIGPVTALEILAAFPASKLTEIKLSQQQLLSGLEEFRKWLTGQRVMGPSRTTLRNKLKNVTLTESFPSLQVVKAYLEPTIDSSKEPFSWAKPDIVGLTEFARKKFGWTRVKSEEILKPVVKRLDETRIQRSIKDYFRTKHKLDSGETESKMSKRVKKAVDRIGGEEKDDSDEEENKPKTSTKRNRSKQGKKSIKKNNAETQEVHKTDAKTQEVHKTNAETQEVHKTNEEVTEIAAGLSSDEDIQILKKTRMQSKEKLEQIQNDVKKELEQKIVQKPKTIASLHKKEVIPQKEMDKIEALRSKMKAIEVFRKSKKGPGYMKKRKITSRKPKEDAELSESSDD